jgi:hypothetical protein
MNMPNFLLGTTRQNVMERNCPHCSKPFLLDLGEPKPEFDNIKPEGMLLDLPLSMKMAQFWEDFGLMANPEWFKEDIKKGNF